MAMTTKLDAISKLTPRIIRILGFNPGFVTLQGTNTYLIGDGVKRILIDTGQHSKPEYINALKNVLAEENAQLAHIILTHWHFDHTGGLKDVFNNFGHAETIVWKYPRTDEKNPKMLDEIPLKYLENYQEIKTDGATLRVIHTPGHTTDHIVLFYKEEETLFTGDCILGSGTTVFEDLCDYMKSLETIKSLEPKILYPGHGPVVEDAINRVEAYIRHRKAREDQIVEVLFKCRGKAITPKNIVTTLYTDVPVNLHETAEKNVKNHLLKLKTEGKVIEYSGTWTLPN